MGVCTRVPERQCSQAMSIEPVRSLCMELVSGLDTELEDDA